MNYSVLLSVYHEEKVDYFIKSLDSLLTQTLPANEIVIVKDGPLTNELDKVIEQYQQDNPDLFTVVPLEENVGLGLALNQGLKVCKNELVARMDTDDIALPTRMEKQIDVFKKMDDLTIVGSNTDEFLNDSSEIISSRVVPSSHDEIVKFSKTRNPFNHPTVMYKKSHVIKCGGYKNLRRNQDYELFTRMLMNGYKGYNINESLLLFRANEDNLKRRKTWNKTKGDIDIRYKFWKEGYIGFKDFAFSTLAFIGAFLMPNWLFDKVSSNILREKK